MEISHSEMSLNLLLGKHSRAATCLHFLQADHRVPVHKHLLSKEDPDPFRTESLHGTLRHLLFLWGFPHLSSVVQTGKLSPSPFSVTKAPLTLALEIWHFRGGTPGAAGSLGAYWNKRIHLGHLLAFDSKQFPSPESKTNYVVVLLPRGPPRQTSPFTEAIQPHQCCKSMAT